MSCANVGKDRADTLQLGLCPQATTRDCVVVAVKENSSREGPALPHPSPRSVDGIAGRVSASV